MDIPRREFLGAGVGLGAALGASFAGLAGAAQPAAPAPQAPATPAPPWSPITDPAIARQVVGLSHRDLDAVREIVDPHPELANSAIDWGFGDWESAIGAASHVGNREIVGYLLSKGARPDLFTFAMLGNLDAVRAMIEASPGLQRIKGPHGLTLAHHARAGGEASASVLAYLQTLDGADDRAVSQPLGEADMAAVLGAYALIPTTAGDSGAGGAFRFQIAQGARGIELRGQDSTNRNLFHVGGLVFHPAGAPSVRLAFTPDPDGRREASLTIGGRRFRCSGVDA